MMTWIALFLGVVAVYFACAWMAATMRRSIQDAKALELALHAQQLENWLEMERRAHVRTQARLDDAMRSLADRINECDEKEREIVKLRRSRPIRLPYLHYDEQGCLRAQWPP